MKKQGFNFIGALNYIVNRYGIDTNLIPDAIEFILDNPKEISETNIRLTRIKNILYRLRHKKISFEKYNILCSAYHMMLFKVSNKEDITDKISKLESKLDLT
jgi:hypothetical protein